ncbi:hypothetical protein BDW62DRAFT_199835 [Aspergillus aurantiobrunneus]
MSGEPSDPESPPADAKHSVCDQIKEIIDALNDIRSQLAEQNKYLDVLTEKYIVKPQISFSSDGWESESDSDSDSQWEESHSIQDQVDDLRDNMNTSAREWSREARLSETSHDPGRYILGFTVATVFYLPMGLVTSFFGMHLFNGNSVDVSQTPFVTVFIVLSLTTYILAGCALWLIRDGDRLKTILGYWKPDASQQTRIPFASRFPALLRRRKAWEGEL